mmetsp:Transcript_50633/g.156715  ORF Transcript_50633/g.156715 Transcript_50633/m.156715 type:complete len:198 (-) Transcript_50633:115-708(-)
MGCCDSTPVLTSSELAEGASCKPGFGSSTAVPSAGPERDSCRPDSDAALQWSQPQRSGPSACQPGSSPGLRRSLNRGPHSGAAPVRLPIRGQHITPELVRLQYREVTPEDYDLLCLLDEALPKRGTTPESTVIRLNIVPARDCNSSTCHICLSEMQPHASVRQLPCQHAFHPECISKWLTQCKGTCPVCSLPIGGGQ